MTRPRRPIQVYREAPGVWRVSCTVPAPRRLGRVKTSSTTWLTADDAHAWVRQLLSGQAGR